jgi:trehalose synthase
VNRDHQLVRNRFLLTRLIADELRLYASVLGTRPPDATGMLVGLAGEHRDPVCGIRVDHTHLRHLEYNGGDYYFCSRTCEEEFAADPERFMRAARLLPRIGHTRRWLRRHHERSSDQP